MPPQTTPPAANVELVRAGFQAFNAGDVDERMARRRMDLLGHGHPAPPAQLTRRSAVLCARRLVSPADSARCMARKAPTNSRC
jgi:hypothetical protein